MSIKHKAFIFDSYNFNNELRPLIESSLLTSNVEKIREFILANKSFITDPYEGEPLDETWEDMIEDHDVHQYGDFALTKYYSPIDDKGLGAEWEKIQKIFSEDSKLDFSPVLGFPVGAESELFDPGKMGSYFQSQSEAQDSLVRLRDIENEVSDDWVDSFEEFKGLLELAAKEKKGIYVTF